MSVDPPRGDAASDHLAWLGNPITVSALVLLLVNDHVLKSAYPGLATAPSFLDLSMQKIPERGEGAMAVALCSGSTLAVVGARHRRASTLSR